MKTEARTVENRMTLKRADELAVGDIIPGGNAPKGHKILSTRTGRIDNMLGLVTDVEVQFVSMDADRQDEYLPVRYTFRSYDRIWTEAA